MMIPSPGVCPAMGKSYGKKAMATPAPMTIWRIVKPLT
jgi:hypothetical protein